MPDEKKDIFTPENKDDVKVEPGEKKELSKDEQIDKLIKLNQETNKRLERLESAGNKKRLDQYDRLHDEDPETVYKLRVIDGKVIIGWSDLHKNKAEVNPITRKIEEDQPLTVFYEEGSVPKEETMQLIIFNRRYEYIDSTLIKETVLKDKEKIAKFGNRIFKVKTEEGKEYIIGEKFIN